MLGVTCVLGRGGGETSNVIKISCTHTTDGEREVKLFLSLSLMRMLKTDS